MKCLIIYLTREVYLELRVVLKVAGFHTKRTDVLWSALACSQWSDETIYLDE